MKPPTEQQLRNGYGCAVLFTVGLLVAWGIVKLFNCPWDTALLIEILWIVSMLRYHQPSLGEKTNGQ